VTHTVVPCRVLTLVISVTATAWLTLGTASAAGEAQSNTTAAAVSAAFDAAYNLDHARAVTLLDETLKAHPEDSDAHRAAAIVAWLRIGFLRGSITVDDYLGSVTKPNINMMPPPQDEAARFHHHIGRALQLAEADLQRQPRHPEAHFRLGAAVGTQASYGATVEGKILASFRSARRAYDAHETVMRLNPSRKDAGLIVGTYRYVVSALSLPVRLMAYVAGFGGDKERGLRMIEDAAAYPSVSQTDAKFALLLLYNRERRYDDAMRIVRQLQQQYPRNRQLWYEGGATLIRADQYAAADAMLTDGIRRRDADRRERMFGEDALWHYKRGVARSRLGQSDAARSDFDIALAREAREWVRGRTHAELGRLAAAAGGAEQARRHYRQAIEFAERGNDPTGRSEAETLLRRAR
jgi:tetratricopeptide (TPR) repeat protein